MASVGIIPAVLSFFSLVLLIPESPRWTAPNSQKTVDVAPVGAKAPAEGAGTPPLCRKSVAVGVGVILCFVFSGNNVIQAYMDIILTAGGADPTTGGALYASTQLLLACLMAVKIIDNVGRRTLLLISSGGSALSMFLMAEAVYRGSSSATIIFACTFIASVTLGLSTLSWIYASEVMPDDARGSGMALGSLGFWASSFVLIEVFANLDAAIGVSGVLLLYACLCLVSLLFVAMFVVETRGRSLEEVQRLFGEGPAVTKVEEPDQAGEDTAPTAVTATGTMNEARPLLAA